MLRERQIARAFYLEAKADLTLAELAYENDIYSRCVSMSQQAVEKILKAALAIVGVYGLREHEVLRYFVKEYDEIIKEELIGKIIDLVRPIEVEWVRSRYPNWTDPTQPVWTPSEQYNRDDAKKALFGTRDVYDLVVDIMKSRFNFEL